MMESFGSMFEEALGMFLFLGAELSILFILISAGVSLLQQYIPDSKIQALLGGAHGRGYLMAALIGAITPFCSCSTIPMLRGLLKAKAGFGPTMTFLFSSPLLNPIIIGLFFATFGMKITVAYAFIALAVSVIAGIVLGEMHFEQYVIPETELANVKKKGCCSSGANVQSSCCNATTGSVAQSGKTAFSEIGGQPICCSTQKADSHSKDIPATEPKEILKPRGRIRHEDAVQSCCAETIEKGANNHSSCSCASNVETGAKTSCCESLHRSEADSFALKLKLAFSDGWHQFRQVSLYLLLGISLGAFIYGFVPSEFIAKYASGDNIFAVPIAAVIGIPLYVRVEALIPLTAVLVGKGMGLGAVMALIIGGGGASITEVILLKSMFRMPMIIAFLAVILGMAILAGYFFQFIL